ncbi:phage holin family protein [Novosphingobium sp.]|uniref:phage holin family protein n=1 Tax=Novosphingobium sp. TaxID=1874826 RepID=UPI0035ADAA48
MHDEQPPLIAAQAGDEARDRSLVDDVRQLVSDGKTLLEAELAYQKTRAAVAGAGAKGVAGWAALALALLFFTLMALVMGLLLALTPLLGGWGAMALVVLGLLAAAGLSGWAAAQRWKKMSEMLADTDDAA